MKDNIKRCEECGHPLLHCICYLWKDETDYPNQSEVFTMDEYNWNNKE